MITLSSSAVAFLSNDNKILLLKRASSRSIAPNVWSGVGGHMEEREINTPMIACYREIFEETGIERSKILSLKMKYIIIRMSDNEIRIIYVYFGETNMTTIINTKEGKLHWILEEDILKREFTMTFEIMLKHYIAIGKNDNYLYTGVVVDDNEKLKINWSIMKNTEKLNLRS